MNKQKETEYMDRILTEILSDWSGFVTAGLSKYRRTFSLGSMTEAAQKFSTLVEEKRGVRVPAVTILSWVDGRHQDPSISRALPIILEMIRSTKA